MMLRIGNRILEFFSVSHRGKSLKGFRIKSFSDVAGFTIMEALITVLVLSLGSLVIYEAFFICLDTFSYCVNYLDVTSRAGEIIWQAQDDLSRFGEAAQIITDGTFTNKKKDFTWHLSYDLINARQGLYKIFLLVSWQEYNRTVKLSRTAYAKYEERLEEN